jgi:hypothetical protein
MKRFLGSVKIQVFVLTFSHKFYEFWLKATRCSGECLKTSAWTPLTTNFGVGLCERRNDERAE